MTLMKPPEMSTRAKGPSHLLGDLSLRETPFLQRTHQGLPFASTREKKQPSGYKDAVTFVCDSGLEMQGSRIKNAS